MSSSLKVEVPSAFLSLYEPNRYKVRYGGRGGAKSWQFADALLIQGSAERLFIPCAREIQKSIQDSVHRLLATRNETLGLGYTVQDKRIFNALGTEFVFIGLKNNVNEVKSLEGADRLWVEEAQAVSDFSWDVVIPTIRKPGSEIWISYNPFDELDPTHQRFVVNPPKGADVQKVSWRDNPWFSAELKAEMEADKARDHNKYLWIWEGECFGNYEESIIRPEWFEAAVDAHKKLGFEPRGVRRVGFDPADIGQDEKACTLAHGVVVEHVHSWGDGDIEDAINTAFSYAYDYDADTITYDSIGVGAAVKVGLKDRIGPKNISVTAFVGSERPRDPQGTWIDGRMNRDVFKNLRAQWWWDLRERFDKTFRAVEKGEYIDPDELISLSSDIPYLSDIRAEVCRVQRKRGNNSFIQVESKEDMRKRDMPSPNRADSLVYCFANNPIKTRKTKINYPRLSIA